MQGTHCGQNQNSSRNVFLISSLWTQVYFHSNDNRQEENQFSGIIFSLNSGTVEHGASSGGPCFLYRLLLWNQQNISIIVMIKSSLFVVCALSPFVRLLLFYSSNSKLIGPK